MAQSKDIVKRKSGRPVKIGATEFVGLRLSSDLLKRIDGWARHEKVERSAAIRRLVEAGLKAL